MTWQPIETAPKDGTEVLLYMPYDGGCGERVVARWVQVQGGWYSTYWSAQVDANPTHWMPLPDPPRTGDKP